MKQECKFMYCIREKCPHWNEVQYMPYIYPTSLSHIPTDALLAELKRRIAGEREYSMTTHPQTDCIHFKICKYSGCSEKYCEDYCASHIPAQSERDNNCPHHTYCRVNNENPDAIMHFCNGETLEKHDRSGRDKVHTRQCENCIRKGLRECMYHGYPDDTIPASCSYKIGNTAVDTVYDVPTLLHQYEVLP